MEPQQQPPTATTHPATPAPTSSTSSSSSSSAAQPSNPSLSRPAQPVQRKSFLGKLPNVTRKIPLPRRPAKLNPFKSGSPSTDQRQSLFSPLDPNSPPLGTLVIKVHSAKELVAKDRNGLSDPFCVIRYALNRTTSGTVYKTLNPVWEDGEAKLEVKVWESVGFGRERIEIILWDKDRLGKEYLGEVSLGLEDVWGDPKAWKKEGEPPVGFFDPDNKPISHPIKSSRSRSHVSGSISVQVGFIPNSPNEKILSTAERTRLLEVLHRVAEEREGARRASKEERVLLASPTEGVGTHTIEEHQQLNVHPAAGAIGVDDLDDESDEDSMDESDTSSIEGETDDSESSETENEEEEGQTPHRHRTEYFDAPLDQNQPEGGSTSTSTATIVASPSPEPALLVNDEPVPPIQPPTPSLSTPSTPGGTNKSRLSLPGFMKRTGSSKSVPQSQSTETSDYSTLNTPSLDSDGKTRRKRFSRKKKGVTEGVASVSTAGLAVGAPAPIRGKKGRKRREREDTGDSTTNTNTGGERKKRLGRKGTKRGYRFEDGNDIFGLVQIETKGAKDLPKFKNMLKTGWDMDPFLVVSFGKKVFRTRVIRHSLNPVWDEKLFFHVRPTETNWIVAFNVYDWDKISSNDHVGDVSVPLSDLLGQSIQPNKETGLYPTDKNGKLVGDDFHDHSLKIQISTDKDGFEIGHPTLEIRAKFTPYAALRQQFWRLFAKTYDIDENGYFSHVEIFSMLDSLGSTLSKETISSFFTRLGKKDTEELSTDELVLCLEQELKKPNSEKKTVETSIDSGLVTPSLGATGLGFGSTANTEGEESMDESKAAPKSDPSGNTKVIQPGTQIVTNEEHGTVVTAPSAQTPASVTSLDQSPQSSDEAVSGAEDTVERVINIKTCPLCHKPRLNSKAELDIVTHMGICASNDVGSVNRIVVGEYVTASQAQRKWFTKVISKATKGAYSLGANSANIIVQDRQTGMLTEEKMAVYVRLGIRLMYKGMGASGGMESARIRRMLESMSHKQGIKFDSPSSVREIAPFIEFHNLNLDEILDPMSSFKNFNEFFYRKLKPDARPVSDPDDPKTLVSPADCRAMFFETVSEATKIWIKGREFSVGRLLGEEYKDKAHLYEGASLAIFRLAPQDYHRYHSPVDGVMGAQHHIAGAYFTVNPMAVRSSIDIYGENVRLVAPIVSPVFGEVMNIWVGAMMVGSICMTKKEGESVKRGEETGYFKFGGSTIVVLFPPGTTAFDEDLLTNSRASVETLVTMGSRIGRRK